MAKLSIYKTNKGVGKVKIEKTEKHRIYLFLAFNTRTSDVYKQIKICNLVFVLAHKKLYFHQRIRCDLCYFKLFYLHSF